jgi:hypothetical protein
MFPPEIMMLGYIIAYHKKRAGNKPCPEFGVRRQSAATTALRISIRFVIEV